MDIGDVSSLEMVVDLLEVTQLLPCQPGQGHEQIRFVDVAVKQRQGGARSFLLTVRVVDEQLIQMCGRLLEPGSRGASAQEVE